MITRLFRVLSNTQIYSGNYFNKQEQISFADASQLLSVSRYTGKPPLGKSSVGFSTSNLNIQIESHFIIEINPRSRRIQPTYTIQTKSHFIIEINSRSRRIQSAAICSVLFTCDLTYTSAGTHLVIPTRKQKCAGLSKPVNICQTTHTKQAVPKYHVGHKTVLTSRTKNEFSNPTFTIRIIPSTEIMNTPLPKTAHSFLSPVDASKFSGRYETTAVDKTG